MYASIFFILASYCTIIFNIIVRQLIEKYLIFRYYCEKHNLTFLDREKDK